LQYKDFLGPKPSQFTPLVPGLFSALVQLSMCSREVFKKIPSRGRQRERPIRAGFEKIPEKFFWARCKMQLGCMKKSPSYK
jgi:hypothetical protein